ncbi:MAG: alpha/beta hydrolase [Gammaproteobacteria bacterium]|nr:alpha/beta hydrolase [Gammaproteobacteria bacterium]
MTTHRIRHEGANLHVETDGDPMQPSLLLWPPGSSTVRVWDHLIPMLCVRFHVIRIDVRGYGQSVTADLRENQFTFDQYTRDARFVLKTLSVEMTHVWSQSWGTRAAIVFCARNQHLVKSAALYAANLGLPDVAAQRRGTKEAADARESLGIEAALPPTGFNEHQNPQAAQLTASALRKIELIDVIEELTMPVLIGTGRYDPNLVSSRDIAARLNDARLVEFDHVGHNAILEHPELALNTFLEFHDALN